MNAAAPAFPLGVTARPAEPLSRHTAWRTGGTCPWWLVVHDPEALGAVIDAVKAADLRWSVLGAGTREVARDGGIDRVMIRLGTGFAHLAVDGEVWEVGGALPAPALAWAAAARGGSGAEVLARTPGSLGAALARDEGAWRKILTEVAVFRRGAVRWIEPDKALGQKLVVGARLSLLADTVEDVTARTRQALEGATALPSWYDPPKRGTAEAELRRVQAAGVRLRAARIPDAAPEMIVNAGRGPARDLKLLHKSALERVKKLRGVTLKSAVTWTGRSS